MYLISLLVPHERCRMSLSSLRGTLEDSLCHCHRVLIPVLLMFPDVETQHTEH